MPPAGPAGQSSASAVWLAVCAAAAAAAGYTAWRRWCHAADCSFAAISRERCVPFSLPARRAAAKHKRAFVLAVELRFGCAEQAQHFLRVWRPLAAYVKRSEPDTLAFEALQADTDPCRLLVYERYMSRAAYEGPHRSSTAFAAFKAAMAALPFAVDIQGQSFIESNDGFML